MQAKAWTDCLWGKNARLSYLMMAGFILLFAFLGHREIWTQEHRWADIVSGMFYRQDFFHPYLNDTDYYDKPLLSYWLIATVSFVTQGVNTLALRLPSAIAAFVSLFAIYQLGTHLKNKTLGYLSAWMLLTTFYFIFWAKTSSADMLNLAGTLSAVAWYAAYRDRPGFWNYLVFFGILAIASLCKGLIAAVVAVLVILPDLIDENRWKKHLSLSLFFGAIPGLLLYFLPFWASAHFSAGNYQESGLELVFRENFMRYFQPFDHKGPIYTYFIFLPVYLFPWTLFFIPALFAAVRGWKQMDFDSRWMAYAVILVFVFLTLSGSRRNYYILPLVPFALLFTGQWILEKSERIQKAGITALLFFSLLFLSFDVLQPLYYAGGGASHFTSILNEKLAEHPKQSWDYVMLDPESKVRFYLHLSPDVKNYPVSGGRSAQTSTSLLQAWPMLADKKSNVIYISRIAYLEGLKPLLPDYDVVEAKPTWGERLLHIHNANAPVAFIPHF